MSVGAYGMECKVSYVLVLSSFFSYLVNVVWYVIRLFPISELIQARALYSDTLKQ